MIVLYLPKEKLGNKIFFVPSERLSVYISNDKVRIITDVSIAKEILKVLKETSIEEIEIEFNIKNISKHFYDVRRKVDIETAKDYIVLLEALKENYEEIRKTEKYYEEKIEDLNKHLIKKMELEELLRKILKIVNEVLVEKGIAEPLRFIAEKLAKEIREEEINKIYDELYNIAFPSDDP